MKLELARRAFFRANEVATKETDVVKELLAIIRDAVKKN
jgi:hypothetical protein